MNVDNYPRKASSVTRLLSSSSISHVPRSMLPGLCIVGLRGCRGFGGGSGAPVTTVSCRLKPKDRTARKPRRSTGGGEGRGEGMVGEGGRLAFSFLARVPTTDRRIAVKDREPDALSSFLKRLSDLRRCPLARGSVGEGSVSPRRREELSGPTGASKGFPLFEKGEVDSSFGLSTITGMS